MAWGSWGEEGEKGGKKNPQEALYKPGADYLDLRINQGLSWGIKSGAERVLTQSKVLRGDYTLSQYGSHTFPALVESSLYFCTVSLADSVPQQWGSSTLLAHAQPRQGQAPRVHMEPPQQGFS